LQLALATHHAVRAWKKDDNKGGKYKHTDIVLVYIYIYMGTKWDAFDQLDIFNIWVCPKIQDALKMAI